VAGVETGADAAPDRIPVPALRLEVLGPVHAWRGDVRLALGPIQQRVVLAVLALHANRPLRREQLIAAIWETAEPAYAVNIVQKYISGLRRVLEPVRSAKPSRVLAWTEAGYRLSLTPGSLDLEVFDREVARARAARVAGQLPEAAQAVHAALQLWRGPAFDGLTNALLDAERTRLDERRVSVIEERIEIDLALGDDHDLASELQRLVAEYPLRERLRGLLMTALYRSGRQAEALTAFRQAARYLRDELGVDPSAELQELHQRILANDASLGNPASAGQRSAGGAGQVSSGGVAEPAGRLPAPAQLPYAIPHFVGRMSELRQLDALAGAAAGIGAAGSGGGLTIAVITGTAGVGKTCMAVRWAHKTNHLYPDGQLYVDLRGFDANRPVMDPGEALRGFLDAFGVPPRRVPGTLEQRAAMYRSLLAGRRVMVVLDNARDTDQVAPLLPGSAGCLVVVTSRNRLSGLLAAGAVAVPLDLLTATESREMLRHRIGPARVDAEPDAVASIISASARLPLALAIVAARAAAQPRFSLAALAGELGQARGGLDAFVGEDRTSDARAVLSWSYQTLSDEAARLFRLLGLHPGPDVSTPAAASLAGVALADVQRQLNALSSTHLIEERTLGRFAFHDLLRAYAAEQSQAPEAAAESRGGLVRMLDHYLHTALAADRLLYPYRAGREAEPPADGVIIAEFADPGAAMDWFVTEHRNLLAVINLAAATGRHPYVYDLAWTMAPFLNYQGHWHDWAATMQSSLSAARCLGDLGRQARAHLVLNLAYLQLGRLDEAGAHAEQALRLFGQLDDQSGRAQIHLNVGRVLERKGNFQQSLEQARKALELFRLANDWAGEADALNWVGWYHSQLGYHEQALEYCHQSLALHKNFGDWPGQADTWDSLGYANHHLGHHDKAVACYEHALTLWHDLGDRYQVAMTVFRLGDTHRSAGDADAARAAWRRAFDIFDGLGHPEAASVQAKLDLLDSNERVVQQGH
jgi:DNA-binding SARP family transcriptional activator